MSQDSTAVAVATNALTVSNVWSGYGDTTVLRGVSIDVPRSSVVALLGANGAGKTTLLKTIAGFVHPREGSIHLAGADITTTAAHRRRRAGLCYIPEGRGIFPGLTVRENLVLHRPDVRNGSVELALEAFPALAGRLSQVAGTLSGGEQQMVAMAQAYVLQPELLLVDEASLGLAPKIVEAIFTFLRTVNERGTAVLLVDQFAARALELASYAYVLQRGELSFSGSPDELRSGDLMQRYLGPGPGADAKEA
jgi:branched-chain amino acid transport system ATP-binding protein